MMLFSESQRGEITINDVYDKVDDGDYLDWDYVKRIRPKYKRTIRGTIDLDNTFLTPGEYMLAWAAIDIYNTELTYADNADLFNDNIFFRKNEFSGFIDFYFSCNDFYAFELAICFNALCFDGIKENLSFNVTKAKKLIEGYNEIRKISQEEKEFAEHVVDLSLCIGPVYSKRMFGGFGIFLEGLMFGLIADNVYYIKVDEETRSEFEELGLEPFTYDKAGKKMNLGYLPENDC